MATNIVGATGIDKVQDGIIVNADIDTVAASKLTGALPAISGASLTGILTGITDILKAYIPAQLVLYIFPGYYQPMNLMALAGTGAVLGHIYPFF